MATPPQQNKARSVYSAEEKRGLLDNFDLEGESMDTKHFPQEISFADPRVTS
jgi:hypothetical protein